MANTGKSIELYIFKLDRTETPTTGEYTSCIVVGVNESSARQIANENSGSEGYVWTDGHKTSAQKLGVADDGIFGIVLWSAQEQ